jgi:WD40 repeat protein/serine/threonine protein kinase
MLGKTLGGRYQIVKHLGGGGFGQTYLASDKQLPGNPLCVVKLLLPKGTDATTLEVARRLFDREARTLYQLGSHDQIPRLLAHFEEEQEFYLVQEFIEGDELKLELSAGNGLSQTKVIDLLMEILKILEFVHQQDVIHRDIKPSNLIRRKQDGKLVLIDFGAVKQVSTQTINTEGQTSFTVCIGSPGYMPNEQLGGKPRFCSDIYAVGMLGIQALTGLPPNGLPEDPKTSEIIWRDRLPAEAVYAPSLLDVLDKMVRYDYRQRYQTAAEAIAALQLVDGELPTQTFTISKDNIPASASASPVSQTTDKLRSETLTFKQQATEAFGENSSRPQAELRPENALSDQQTMLENGNNIREAHSDLRDRKPSIFKFFTKPRRAIAAGASIATALALATGIYYFQTLNRPWDRVENISLANTLSGHLGQVYSLAISPDGYTLASGSLDNTIKLWNLPNGAPQRTLMGHSDWVYSVAFSPDGKTLASSSADGTIKLWNPSSAKVRTTLEGHSDWVFSVAFSPDGRTLASGGKDKTIKLWDIRTGQLKNTLKGHTDFVSSVAITPDSQSLVSGSKDKTIKLWNLARGQLLLSLSDPSNYPVSSVAISPDGNTLVSSSFNTISIWNLRNLVANCKGAQACLPVRTLSGHVDEIRSITISPDGHTIASGSLDGTLKLWNLQTGELKSTISNQLGFVDAVTFSPDGQLLVSASKADNTIKIWRSQ